MPIALQDDHFEKAFQHKIRFAAIIISLVFVFILSRLVYLQVLTGNRYVELSTTNRIRVTKTPYPRGIFFSQNRDPLVKNTPSFDLTLIPQDTPNAEKAVGEISELLKIDRALLADAVMKKRGRPPFEPIVLKKEISWNEMSLVLSRRVALQGIQISVTPKRLYCLGNFASHVFGFLGEIDRDELEKEEFSTYDRGDLIGKYGLEKWCEEFLRGKKGGLQSEVDVHGNRQRILAEIKAVPGCNIITSIVPELQKVAENLLSNKTGAVVAISPANGEILVMASSPAFDANSFSRGIDHKSWQQLVLNSRHPLLNRAIQTQQPPGSVFKIVTAIAALEEHLIDPDTKFFCPGYYTLGTRTFKCWKKGGHGAMDMKNGIIESCDVYFYNLALRVGIDRIAQYAQLLGFGEKTGVELDDEKSGLVPTAKWKKQRYGIPWQKGETLNVAIGQGFVLTTPIQLARVFSGLANGGRLPQPHLVLGVDCEEGPQPLSRQSPREYALSESTLGFIKAAMAGVVNAPNGTARSARLGNIEVAGKTGTAQVVSQRLWKSRPKDNLDLYEDHAWFVSFAPVDKPEIVVVVFVEHGGGGGRVAAPIAKEVLDCFFKNRPSAEISSVSNSFLVRTADHSGYQKDCP